MICIPLHKTWQMNLLWLMDPPVPEQRFMITSTQILADKPTLANGPPWYQRRDGLNTSTQYFADELTLPNGTPRVTGLRCLHTANDIYWSRMAISLCYWHLVIKHGNFTLLLTSCGQEWQFHIATDILWSWMAISHCYWDLVVKNCNFTLLLTSSDQEWQCHTTTDI